MRPQIDVIKVCTEERTNYHKALTTRFEEWMVEISSLVEKTGNNALAKAEGVHGDLLAGVEKGKQEDLARYDQLIQRIEVLENRNINIF